MKAHSLIAALFATGLVAACGDDKPKAPPATPAPKVEAPKPAAAPTAPPATGATTAATPAPAPAAEPPKDEKKK